MSDSIGVFYGGSFTNGEEQLLSAQDVTTAEGQQAVLDFVSAGLAVGASPITLFTEEG